MRKKKMFMKKMVSVMLMSTIMGNTVMANAQTSVEENVTQMNQDVYAGSGYTVTYCIDSRWNGGYNGTVTIENTGEKTIANWALKYENSDKIVSVWNGEILSRNENEYIIKNAGWNQDIEPGQLVSYGFQAEGTGTTIPSEFSVPVRKEEVPSGEYSVERISGSEWNSGFTGNIQITNLGEKEISNWVLSFDYDRNITQVYNGEILEHQGNHYIIKYASYNKNIDKNGTVQIGIMGDDTGTDAEIYNVDMEQSVIELNAEGTDETEYIQLPDGQLDKLYVENMILPVLQMDNPDASVADIRIADDYDGDGLDSEAEYEQRTDPFVADYDGDGLMDGEEAITYGTDPLYEDTDGDGMTDGTEIQVGMNPLSQDSDGNGVSDDKETTTQDVRIHQMDEEELKEAGVSPYVRITGDGDYSTKLYAENCSYDTDKTELDYIVGAPYEFVHDDSLEFESSTLGFDLSEDILHENNIADLAIAYYDEEEGRYLLLDTSYDTETNRIWAEVEHYSTYAVVNNKSYINAVSQNRNADISLLPARKVADFGDSTYAIVDMALSWEEASKYCYECGGHLVTIETADEQKFLSELMSEAGERNLYWLGLTGIDNQYGWINGSKLEYQNWAPGEPNDRMETYAHMYNRSNGSAGHGQWNDTLNYCEGNSFYGTVNSGFICEFDESYAGLEGKCYVKLTNGQSVRLDKDPRLGDENVDTDRDGICDLDELLDEGTGIYYDKYLKKTCSFQGYRFISNPASADTDGDGIGDAEDFNPRNYDIRITGEHSGVDIGRKNYCDTIEFNTGRTWYVLNCTANEYCAYGYSGKSKMTTARMTVVENAKQDFSQVELMGALSDQEGLRIYLNDKESVARILFRKLYGREPVSYQHTGEDELTYLGTGNYGTGSYKEGYIISEVELLFTLRPYNLSDTYVADEVCGNYAREIICNMGVDFALFVVFAGATSVIKTNVEKLNKLMKGRGIEEGFDYYRYYIEKGDADGVLSVMQREIKSGVNSVDDVVAQGQKVFDDFNIDSAYVKPKHLSTTGGNGQKFIGASKSEAESVLKDVLSNGTITSIADNGLTKAGNASFEIIIDAGKVVGTKGETLVKIVISSDGGMLSAYPIK